MEATTLMAISKSVSSKDAKAARQDLAVGEHEIDANVRLIGTLTVAEDQEIAPTASLMSVEFLMLTLKRAGVTRESAMRVITDMAGEYLVDWTGSKDNKKAAKAARKAAVAEFDPDGLGEKVFDEFKAKLPKIPRAGKVVFKGDIVEVGDIVEEDVEIVAVEEPITKVG